MYSFLYQASRQRIDRRNPVAYGMTRGLKETSFTEACCTEVAKSMRYRKPQIGFQTVGDFRFQYVNILGMDSSSTEPTDIPFQHQRMATRCTFHEAVETSCQLHESLSRTLIADTQSLFPRSIMHIRDMTVHRYFLGPLANRRLYTT